MSPPAKYGVSYWFSFPLSPLWGLFQEHTRAHRGASVKNGGRTASTGCLSQPSLRFLDEPNGSPMSVRLHWQAGRNTPERARNGGLPGGVQGFRTERGGSTTRLGHTRSGERQTTLAYAQKRRKQTPAALCQESARAR